jgi:hypothetical protein
MDRLAGEIAIMWLAIGGLGIAVVFGFMFLWYIVTGRSVSRRASREYTHVTPLIK